MGVPATLDAVAATQPYYRSTYVICTRRDRQLEISIAFRSGCWRIAHRHSHRRRRLCAAGANAWPAAGFRPTSRASVCSVRMARQNPPAQLIEAVANGDVDVAIVWGPLAGYFREEGHRRLWIIAPVSPSSYLGRAIHLRDFGWRCAKAIPHCVGEIDRVLDPKCDAIQSLLEEYGVPLVRGGGHRCELRSYSRCCIRIALWRVQARDSATASGARAPRDLRRCGAGERTPARRRQASQPVVRIHITAMHTPSPKVSGCSTGTTAPAATPMAAAASGRR